MSDVSSHEAGHASDAGSHGHVPTDVPIDPNDAVVRARPPAPLALILTVVAAIVTLLVLVASAVASGQGA